MDLIARCLNLADIVDELFLDCAPYTVKVWPSNSFGVDFGNNEQITDNFLWTVSVENKNCLLNSYVFKKCWSVSEQDINDWLVSFKNSFEHAIVEYNNDYYSKVIDDN